MLVDGHFDQRLKQNRKGFTGALNGNAARTHRTRASCVDPAVHCVLAECVVGLTQVCAVQTHMTTDTWTLHVRNPIYNLPNFYAPPRTNCATVGWKTCAAGTTGA